MLNGLLAQLDTIENDGDEEVRNVRKGVGGLEKALEDLERKVSSQASSHQGRQAEVYDVEAGEYENPTSYDVVSHQLTPH
jgi:hypothetical protein